MYPSLLFEQSTSFQQQAFLATPLGQLYQAIPFAALAGEYKLPPVFKSGKGCKPWFDVKGGIALQVLKSYYRCSDAMLIEQLNGNWEMQLFCGILLKPGERIKDKDIVGRWRKFLGEGFDLDKLQLRCVQHWRPYMEQVHTGFCDATVFESYIEYPTDAKLIWKCCQEVYQLIKKGRKQARLRDTRINHGKRKNEWLCFAKRRRKTKRQNKKICRRLLKYLLRLVTQLELLTDKKILQLKARQQNRFDTIKGIKEQQWQLYYGGQLVVTDRVVSIHKPYVRPIVRGKEVKPVEFGAKVHMLLVDGISFMEHISFDNFNEGTRLQSAIHLQRRYFGACWQIGADAIYATNVNRRYCTENKIATGFVPKGNEGKHSEQKSQMRSILSKVRSTVLEGSFGNEKNHYQLSKIKAKSEDNEKAWIFFGLLACNAMQIAKRMQAATPQILKQAA